MSSTNGSQDLLPAVESLGQCLTDWRLTSNIVVASAALIFYDWFLTSGDEVTYLWHRERGNYARLLFILARYPALACVIVDLLPLTMKLNDVAICLRFTAITSSGLILATRAWAIWDRSRRILVFLVVLVITGVVVAIAKIERRVIMTVVAPSVTASVKGVQYCRMLVTTDSDAWCVPYIVMMMFDAVVLALTSYKVLQFNSGIPKQWRSKLLDVLWINGIIYFIFMLILGILNVGLVLKVSDPQLRDGGSQLQTVFHSVLSTRIAMHTAEVFRQDVVGSRPTLSGYQPPTRIEFAHWPDISGEIISESDQESDDDTAWGSHA